MRLLFKRITGKMCQNTQTVVCFVLIAVMLVMSFGNLYTLKVEVPKVLQNGMDKIEEVINDPMISNGEDIEIVMPDELSVNLFLFIRASTKIKDVVEIYKSMVELSEVSGATDTNEYYQAYARLRTLAADAKELISSDEFLNLLALASAFVSGFGTSALNGIVMVMMVLMTVIMPISLLIALIVALFAFLADRKDTERRYLAMMKAFRRAARVFLLVIAVKLFDMDIGLSFGIIMGLIACVGGFAFSALASHGKRYTPEGKRYMNISQIASLVTLSGFFIFYFGIAYSGAVGQYFAIVAKDAFACIFSKEYGEVFRSQFIFMLFAVLTVAAFVATLSVLTGTLARMGGMLPRHRESLLVPACASLLMIAVPLYMRTVDNRISFDHSQSLALSIAFLGIVIMILAEVAKISLQRILCPTLKESEKYSILRGLDAPETEGFDDEE